MLLQILEDGTLTDAKGRKVDFSNTIVIMTSNLGAENLQKEVSLGFSAETRDDKTELEQEHARNVDRVNDALRKFMRPELINRIDKVIVFRSLTKPNIRKIIDVQVSDLQNRLHKQKLSMTLTNKAKDWLLDHGYDLKNGVRPLRRLIQDSIEDRIAEGVLEGEYEPGSVIAVDVASKELTFQKTKE